MYKKRHVFGILGEYVYGKYREFGKIGLILPRLKNEFVYPYSNGQVLGNSRKRTRTVSCKGTSDFELSASEIDVNRWKREDRGELYGQGRIFHSVRPSILVFYVPGTSLRPINVRSIITPQPFEPEPFHYSAFWHPTTVRSTIKPNTLNLTYSTTVLCYTWYVLTPNECTPNFITPP